jgi:hypothetical protein
MAGHHGNSLSHTAAKRRGYAPYVKASGTIPKTLESQIERVARRLRKAPRLVLRESSTSTSRHYPEADTQAIDRVAGAVGNNLEGPSPNY